MVTIVSLVLAVGFLWLPLTGCRRRESRREDAAAIVQRSIDAYMNGDHKAFVKLFTPNGVSHEARCLWVRASLELYTNRSPTDPQLLDDLNAKLSPFGLRTDWITVDALKATEKQIDATEEKAALYVLLAEWLDARSPRRPPEQWRITSRKYEDNHAVVEVQRQQRMLAMHEESWTYRLVPYDDCWLIDQRSVESHTTKPHTTPFAP